MPGSPPTSTREPFTIPPPNTLSSSSIWVPNRSSPSVSISRSITGFFTREKEAFPPPMPDTDAGRIFSSTKVFHCLQPGHCPSHLLDSYPHSWQKNTVVCLPFAIFFLLCEASASHCERYLPLFPSGRHRIAALYSVRQDFLRQRILHHSLDRTPQGPCPHL